MSLSTPLGLLLLAVLPVLIYIGRPRHAYRRTRDLAALAVRCVLVVLLVLALSGLQLTRGGDALAVVFLVDASDSVGRARTDQAVQAVRGQIEQMGERTSAGIVLFGGAPAIDRPVSASTTPDSGTTIVSSTDATNLAAAVRIALAMFPAEAGKRIVILSDGVQTAGDAEQAAQLAAAAGVEIDYQPMLVSAEPDVRLVGFEAPASVGAGQQFEVVATVESDFDTDIRLEIYAGADFLEGQTYTLEAGTTSLVLGLTSQDEGFRDFTARVIPLEGDGFSQNNSLSAFTQVTGAARVLLVGEASETQALEAALTEARLVVERLTPGSLPTTSQGFAQYDSVVLANVPEFDLTDQTETALRDYVRDGGGLLVVGGPDSYAPGLYRDTPLEEVLPVEMRLSDPQRLPKLTIAYLIDRSGSMATVTDAGQSFIELAKAAIDNSLGFLQPDDIAGVASFDTSAYWVAEFQRVGNAEEMRRLLGTLRASGGTDIGAGLALVADDIVVQDSEAKHIIVMSDGISNRRGLIELVADLNTEHGVTLTSIAIGEENELMRDLAEAGRGAYHLVEDPSTIPNIFAQETVLATRTYIIEQPFTPTLTALSPILSGIDALPALRGYVGTTEKAAAQVILRGPAPYDDPILAAWQYGLGRAVAFTSDATARWASEWVGWGEYARFWSQAVQWTIIANSEGVEARVAMSDGLARITLDARDAEGGFLNGLALQTTVVRPDGTPEVVRLRQVAPGQYEGVFTPSGEGAYLLRTGSGDGAVTLTSGWVFSYSSEYLTRGQASVLPRMAELTGGQAYPPDDLSGAFERGLPARGGVVPLAPWLLLAALVLLPFDVAVRRLLITRGDLARLRDALRRAPASDSTAERMAPLRQARDRARQSMPNAAPPEAPSPAQTIGQLRAKIKSEPSAPPVIPIPSRPPTVPTRPPEPVAGGAPPSGESTAARLLRNKQKRDER